MPKPKGKKPGRLLHAEAFEAILAARNLLKKDVATDAGISPQQLGYLLSHKGGASPEAALRLASTLGVKPAAIFPEEAGWIGPIPDRDNVRAARRSKAAA